MSITLIIQGQKHFSILQTIKQHKQYFDEIILSTWEESSASSCKVIANDTKEAEKYKKYIPHANAYFQFYSTLQGLKQVKTDFVMKQRTDEFYTNLEPMINLIKQNPDKFCCLNVFIEQWRNFPYYISDHVFGTNTKDLLNTFQYLEKCFDENKIESWINQEKYSIESIFARSYCLSKNGYLDLKKDKDEFRILNCNLLGDYTIRANHQNIIYRNGDYKNIDVL